MTTTPGGLLLVLSIIVPFVGVIAGFVLGGRWARRIAFAVMAAGIVNALAIGHAYLTSGGPVVYLLGGWAPPLGVALRADALAVAMLALVAVVVTGIGVYAWDGFATPADTAEEMRGVYDEVVCLVCPRPFWSVGSHYDDFSQVSDVEVVEMLESEWGRVHRGGAERAEGDGE